MNGNIKLQIKRIASLAYKCSDCVQLFTIAQVRRNEQWEAEDEGKTLLKDHRWIMLKKNLTRKQNRKLTEVMEENQNIAKAMEVLDEWTEQCEESELKPFKKLAKRLNRWKDGILAYFVHKITNGMSGGINNKIKLIKRRNYGGPRYGLFLKILKATGFIPDMREDYL